MLAVVPIRDGALPAGGAEAVAECGGRALLVGSNAADAAAALAGIATSVMCYEAAAFDAGSWAAALAPLLADEAHVVLPASPDGRDLAPRLASSLRRELLAGAIEVAPHRVQLARRGGLVIDEVRPDGGFVATLQPGVRGVEADLSLPPATVTAADLGAAAGRPGVQVVATLAPDASTMDLAESPRIIGGGAGLTSAEKFAELQQLSSALDASMGATRVITDRGWVGHERQIGTTGVVVAPQLYLAFGISGAVQHTSGLGQPAHIVSVNTDPHCPMMQLADLAIVSDANEVVTELLQLVATEHIGD